MAKTYLNALTRKDTFWNRKRVENNIQFKELSEVLHLARSTLGSYFTGQVLPPEDVVKQLCDLFDIDYAEGMLEFQHAHRQWKSDRTCTKVIIENPAVKPVVMPVATEKVTEPSVNPEVVFGALYGKIPYEQFEELRRIPLPEDMLKYLYGKVDYTTYCELIKALR